MPKILQNRKKSIVLAVMFILCIVAGYRSGVVKGAADAIPGTAADPLVTRSYLEQQLSQTGAGGGTFSQVVMAKGEQIVLSAGSEVLVYRGSAAVTGDAGLVNMTTGELFRSGNSIVRYHLYLAPASDSGLSADGSVTVFIKGRYTKK